MTQFFLKFVSSRPTQIAGKVGPFDTAAGAQQKYREMLAEGKERQPAVHDPRVAKHVVDEDDRLVINIG